MALPVDSTIIEHLKQFINPQQLQVMLDAVPGEEGEHFRTKLIAMDLRIKNMAKTYEQDGKGDDAIVYLHYFLPSADWFILEKDVDTDGEGQQQAFGYASLNGWPYEMGYISIAELLSYNAELDLYFDPCNVRDFKRVYASGD